MTPPAHAPAHAPGAEVVLARAGGENFPVASRLLARDQREHLLALYGFARLVDELGDAEDRPPEQRLDALDWVQAELDRALAGEHAHPLLARVAATARACQLPRGPFVRLIEANRADQRVTRYRTWEELRGYCACSADPVGELVLGVFGLATPQRVALSDSICTALQLIEHCQDVAEDLALGRVYLPAEDLRRFDCDEGQLHAAHAGPQLRAVIAFELARARRLLSDGAPLIAQLRGRPRLAVAAFAAGGAAAVDAIERARCDVLAGAPRAGRRRRALALAVTLWRARAAARAGRGGETREPALARGERDPPAPAPRAGAQP